MSLRVKSVGAVVVALCAAGSAASAGPAAAAAPSRTTGRTQAPATTASAQPVGRRVRVTLRAVDAQGDLDRTEYRVDGGRWRTYAAPTRSLLNRSAASFARWRRDGSGTFTRRPDGSVQTGSGVLGLLWYPAQQFGDIAVSLQFRDARSDRIGSNGGVFIRFPDPLAATSPGHTPLDCQRGPALLEIPWVAIACGQEIQINDGTADPQATGSIYNFKSLGVGEAGVVPQGRWNRFEIRVRGGGDYAVQVIRNGRLINRFRNTPGQRAHREGDPPTDARQFARGHIGLQSHTPGDLIQYRDVAVRSVAPKDAAVALRVPRRRVLEYRSVDFSGHVEPTHRRILGRAR